MVNVQYVLTGLEIWCISYKNVGAVYPLRAPEFNLLFMIFVCFFEGGGGLKSFSLSSF